MPRKTSVVKDLPGGSTTERTARRLPESSETRSGKGRVIPFPLKSNPEQPDPTEPTPFVAGGSPSTHRLEAKRGLVLYQFVDTDGDTRVVARRHGVTEMAVKRTIARMLRPVVSKILREAA